MIQILESGQIQVKTVRDGIVWRGILNPGDETRARELLVGDDLAQALAAWTPEIIAAWKAKQDALIDRAPHLAVSEPTAPRRFIRGDGADTLSVSVSQYGATSMDVTVNGEIQAVPLTNGAGVLEILSDQPGTEILVAVGVQAVTIEVI